jgi:hypothetical protein
VTIHWQTPDIRSVIAERSIPGVTMWNRLEGRPRAEDFNRALKAEVRDALWMLTKQWQLGEFFGDDAGSPIFTKVHVETTRLRAFRADGHPTEPFDDSVPLEARVEARPLPFVLGARDFSLDLRLLMGRQWLKMMATVGDFASEFVTAYPIHEPDPTDRDDAVYCAQPEAWAAFTAVTGRRMDGAKLYLYLIDDSSHHAWDGIAALDPHRSDVDEIAGRFLTWFERLIHQPSGGDAWVPERLEYQFACSAPGPQGETVLAAEEYFHGHLDWYNVDAGTADDALGIAATPGLPRTETQTLLPTPVSFEGMPNTRWWSFEDGRTNFGDVRPDTTDIGKLLLLEFGLVFSNDWFLIPYMLEAGSIARVRGIAVTNVFGERTWVEPAGTGQSEDRWAMFRVDEDGSTGLVLLPVAPTLLQGGPLEDVALIRDEVANMVWGVEVTVALPSGDSKPGREAALEMRTFFERDLERRLGHPPEPPPAAEGAAIRYQVMSSVPENWIPFVPVHVAGDNREIQLQRAAMPRVLEGDPEAPLKVRPRTALLRAGLDGEAATAYLLHEEEVPRAGAQVSQSYQRTRWRGGRALVWLGARKQVGRGEGSSGLAFDRIVDVPAGS